MVWSSAAAHPAGQDPLLLWVPQHYLKETAPQISAVAPDGTTPAQVALREKYQANVKRLPNMHYVAGMTGMSTAYDRALRKLRANNVTLSDHGRQELWRELTKLKYNLGPAVNEKFGHLFPVHSRRGEKPLFVTKVKSVRMPGVARVGATEDKDLLERVQTLIRGLSDRQSTKQETSVQASAEFGLYPLPKVSVGVGLFMAWAFTNTDSTSAAQNGLHVNVHKSILGKSTYETHFRHHITLTLADRPDVVIALEPVDSEALLNIPQVDAFEHGFSVDADVLRVKPPAGATTVEYSEDAINDKSVPADQLNDVRIEEPLTNGFGFHTALTEHDDQGVDNVLKATLTELAVSGFVPADWERLLQDWKTHKGRDGHRKLGGADMQFGAASRIANLRVVLNNISRSGFDGGYDETHQNAPGEKNADKVGLSFVLRGDPALGQVRNVRVTLSGRSPAAQLKALSARGNSVTLKRQTPALTIAYLDIPIGVAGYGMGGGKKLTFGVKGSVGESLLQMFSVSAQYERLIGANVADTFVGNVPILIEFGKWLNEHQFVEQYQVHINYGDMPGRATGHAEHRGMDPETKVWSSPEFAVPVKAHLIPSFSSVTKPAVAATQKLDVRALRSGVVFYSDVHGVQKAMRRLQDRFVGPDGAGEQAVANFGSLTMIRSWFESVVTDGDYQTGQLFESGFWTNKHGGLRLGAKVGQPVILGRSSDPLVTGRVRANLREIAISNSRGHGWSTAVGLRMGDSLPAEDGLGGFNTETSANLRYGRNQNLSKNNTSGVELLQLNFEHVIAMAVPVNYQVGSFEEKHNKLVPTYPKLAQADVQGDRWSIVLWPEPWALKNYGKGWGPMTESLLLDALRRWQGKNLKKANGTDVPEDEVSLALSNAVVGSILDRMDSDPAMSTSGPLWIERQSYRATYNSGDRDALTLRLRELGKTKDQLAQLPYLPGALGHHGVHSMTFQEKPATGAAVTAPVEVSLLKGVYDTINKAEPDLLTPLGGEWELRGVPPESSLGRFWQTMVGNKKMTGRLTSGTDFLRVLLSGGREMGWVDDMMHTKGMTFELVNTHAGVVTTILEVKLGMKLTSTPNITDYVPRTGQEIFDHNYKGQNKSNSRDLTGGVTAGKFGFAGEGGTSKVSGGPQADFGGGVHSSNATAQQETKEDTSSTFKAQYDHEARFELDVEVTPVKMPHRPINNAVASVLEAVTGRGKTVKQTFVGDMDFYIPAPLIEGELLQKAFDPYDLTRCRSCTTSSSTPLSWTRWSTPRTSWPAGWPVRRRTTPSSVPRWVFPDR